MITVRMIHETLYEVCRDDLTIVWLEDEATANRVKSEIERLESRIADLEKTVDDLRSSNEDELIQYAVQGKYVFEGYERWLDFGSPFKYLSTALSSAENLSKTRESRVVKTYTRYETLPD